MNFDSHPWNLTIFCNLFGTTADNFGGKLENIFINGYKSGIEFKRASTTLMYTHSIFMNKCNGSRGKLGEYIKEVYHCRETDVELYDCVKKWFRNEFFKNQELALCVFSMIDEENKFGLSDIDEVYFALFYYASLASDEDQKNIRASQFKKFKNDYISYIKSNFTPFSVLKEINTLASGRKISELYFKQIKDRGRFKSYINTNSERIVIKNKLKISRNSEEYDLSELVFGTRAYNIDADCSISLHGVGGTGKTFQLLSLYDLILHPDTADSIVQKLPKELDLNTKIPLYLELNDVRSSIDNCILVELSSRLGVGISVLVGILQEQGGNIILLLDGYNEVTSDELREEIAKRICDIRRDYKTRIVITSRLDHSDMFNRINRGETAIFTQAEIQPLSPSQVNEYFEKIEVHRKSYNRLNKSEQHLVQTAQGLSMYGALLKKDSKRQIQNLGTLLREYVNDIVLEDATNTNFEIYLEEIAYHMVLNGWFRITPENLKLLLGDKYDKVIRNSFIQKLFVINSKGNFEYTHQNFRDMYCSLFFNKLLKNAKENIGYFESNNVTTNDEILALCGDLIKNDAVIQDSINKLKK